MDGKAAYNDFRLSYQEMEEAFEGSTPEWEDIYHQAEPDVAKFVRQAHRQQIIDAGVTEAKKHTQPQKRAAPAPREPVHEPAPVVVPE
jgi:hypothetical protein